MAVPNASSGNLMVLLVGLLGPTLGEYSLIVMAALAGALWPLSAMEGTTRVQGVFFLARVVLTAIFVSGGAAMLLNTHFDMPVVEGMSIVAFGVGAIGNGWRSIFTSLVDGLAKMLQMFGAGGRQQKGGRQGRGRYDDDSGD
jgi:hypothetical protein